MKSIGAPVSLSVTGRRSPLSFVILKGVPSSFSIVYLTHNSVSDNLTYWELLPIIEKFMEE